MINHPFKTGIEIERQKSILRVCQIDDGETVHIYSTAVGNQEIEFHTSFVVEHIFHKAYAVVRVVRLLLCYTLHYIPCIHGKKQRMRKPKLKEYTLHDAHAV